MRYANFDQFTNDYCVRRLSLGLTHLSYVVIREPSLKDLLVMYYWHLCRKVGLHAPIVIIERF